VASAPDGAEALRRIAAIDAPLLAFRDPGSFTIVQKLWRQAGLRPGPRQQLYDDAERPQDVLRSAARQQAYAVVGHIPVALGKIPDAGLRVLLKGDPAMRRVFVLVEPGPQHPATPRARRQAHRLADFLLSPAGQRMLGEVDLARGGPWIFPLPGPERP
jgi:tungstate transport system substrate-binding protein